MYLSLLIFFFTNKHTGRVHLNSSPSGRSSNNYSNDETERKTTATTFLLPSLRFSGLGRRRDSMREGRGEVTSSSLRVGVSCSPFSEQEKDL